MASIKVGLVGSLFGPATEETNNAMLAVFDRYVERFGQHLKTFLEGDTGEARPFGAREKAYARRRLTRPGKTVYTQATSSNDMINAGTWYLEADFARSDPRTLSGIGWSIDSSVELPRMTEQFVTASASGAFLHGYAGCGVVPPLQVTALQSAANETIALTSRFVGLDVMALMDVRMRALEGIKCVNWLTFVADQWLDRLGGRATVRGKLSADVVFHELSGGVVIQAGSHPVTGDTSRPEELQPYRNVARVLKPIYSQELKLMDGLWDNRTNREFTLPWRERFFRGAKWPP